MTLHFSLIKTQTAKSLGTIAVEGAMLLSFPPGLTIAGDAPSGFMFGVTPQDTGRMYLLLSDTAADRDSWISALEQAGGVKRKVRLLIMCLLCAVLCVLIVQ